MLEYITKLILKSLKKFLAFYLLPKLEQLVKGAPMEKNNFSNLEYST